MASEETLAFGEDDGVPLEVDEEQEEGREEMAKGDEEAMEYGDEVEEGEDEGTYDLRFYGEMDPLEFALKETEEVEIYQQFQRVEYEALAERKRKALADQQNRGSDVPAKKPRHEDVLGATMEEINEMMNFGSRRRSRAPKKRGRRKGSKNKVSAEVSRKIGDATLHYASGDYDEAVPILEEVVQLAPCSPDAYYILGLIYDDRGDRKKALNFHMIAAHLTPKDSSSWKKLVAWSIEQKNTGQIRYCLLKAITADPKDVGLRFDLALLYFELGDYQKAAETYSQVVGLYPGNIQARIRAAKMYRKCGQVERAVSILEDYVNDHISEVDQSTTDLLITLQMENNAHMKALNQIDHAALACGSERNLPLHLKAKALMCHAHLGNVENVEVLLKEMQMEQAEAYADLITEVGDTFAKLQHYHYALKFYLMLESTAGFDNGDLHLKIAQCYIYMKERGNAISFFYKALSIVEDNVDARITLSSLLLEEGKEDEAIILLSAPKSAEQNSDLNSAQYKPWWISGKVRMQLAKIYRAKGMLKDFVGAIFSCIHETLVVEAMNHKVKARKRLTRSVLCERVKLLDNQQGDNVFHRFRPIAAASELLKAARAKKSLEKKAALREEKKAAALAAGLDWQSEDSEDEAPRKAIEEPPLPGLLKDEEHHQLIIDLCKALLSLRLYLEALEIINLTLRLLDNTISLEKKEELRSLGAQIAYNTRDPKQGYDYARYIVQQHPYSVAAWNRYYKVVSRGNIRGGSRGAMKQGSGIQMQHDADAPIRSETRFSKHIKFLHRTRMTLRDCVPPMIINGHQFTMISQHQAAAREYLEAYKLQPEDPLINLCAGTALINLALGFRLQNKHQSVVQGFAFLYNYLRICNSSQESMYNIARAYHHVGLVTLAALYYEKVLSIQEKDYPLPKLPNEVSNVQINQKPGYCNLHREAAYNLHLIYKKSGAVDLARQVLKNYCTF